MKYAVLCIETQREGDVEGYLVYDSKEQAVRAATAIQTLDTFISFQDFNYEEIGDAYIEAQQKGTEGYNEYGPVSVFKNRTQITAVNFVNPARIHYQVLNFKEDDFFVSNFDNALSRIENAINLNDFGVRHADRLDIIWGIIHAEEELLSAHDPVAYQEVKNAIVSWSKTMVPFDSDCMEIVENYVAKMRSTEPAS